MEMYESEGKLIADLSDLSGAIAEYDSLHDLPYLDEDIIGNIRSHGNPQIICASLTANHLTEEAKSLVLCLAIEEQHAELVDMLLEKTYTLGIKVNCESLKPVPLVIAVEKGDVNTARMLQERGADIAIKGARGTAPELLSMPMVTAWELAIEKQHTDMLLMMYKYFPKYYSLFRLYGGKVVEILTTDRKYASVVEDMALCFRPASVLAFWGIVRYLKGLGKRTIKDIILAVSFVHNYMMYLAYKTESLKDLVELLEAGECDVDWSYTHFKDHLIWSPCGLEYIKLCLKYDADFLALSPVYVVCQMKCFTKETPAMLQLVLEAGGDPCPLDLSEMQINGTPLSFCYDQLVSNQKTASDAKALLEGLEVHSRSVLECVKLLLDRLSPDLKVYNLPKLNDMLLRIFGKAKQTCLDNCCNYTPREVHEFEQLVADGEYITPTENIMGRGIKYDNFHHGIKLYADITELLLIHSDMIPVTSKMKEFDDFIQFVIWSYKHHIHTRNALTPHFGAYALNLASDGDEDHHICVLWSEKYESIILKACHLYQSHGWRINNLDNIVQLLSYEPRFSIRVLDLIINCFNYSTYSDLMQCLVRRNISVIVGTGVKAGHLTCSHVLSKYANYPRSLKVLSRLAIYLALNMETAVKVKGLPLPNALKSYICDNFY